MVKSNEFKSTPPLDLEDIVSAAPANKEPLLENDSLTPPPSPSNSVDDLPSPSSNIKKKGKQIINRAKAIPVTKTQKRARWVPGHRYMPFLVLQWFWHPISVLIESRKTTNHVNDQKLHHEHHHHHHHHNDNVQVGPSSSNIGSQVILTEGGGGDIFME